MQELKRTFSLKLGLSKQQEEQLNSFMQRYGEAVNYTLRYLENLRNDFEELKIQKEGKCYRCESKENKLKWIHKTEDYKICNKCYVYQFSYFCLTKADGFQKQLIEAFPDLSPSTKGYYGGVEKFSPQIFKSYVSKLEERKREIEQLKEWIQSTSNIKQQIRLEKKLRHKSKGIKPLNFKKNVIFYGSAGMFDLKEEDGKYWIGVKSPYEKKSKIWYELKLGKKEDYHTDHNKYSLLENAIKNKDYKRLFGKILRRKNYYEFMFPKRDISSSITTNPEIEKFYLANKKVPIVCISFGILRPINIMIFINKKIKVIKTFGNGSLWHYINRERAYRAKVMKIFAKRYQKKWRRRKAIRKFYKKRTSSERNRIKYETHKLTTDVITYLRDNFKKAVVVMRDTKGIKRINYPPIYRVVLDRWNIEMQKTFLEYKELLSNFHIYRIPYRESNNVSCSKCGKELKEDKKNIKILTVKLNHAMNRRAILSQKLNALNTKKLALLKYPSTKENRLWLQQYGEESTKIAEALAEGEKKNHKIIACECGYKNGVYENDNIMLFNKFIHAH